MAAKKGREKIRLVSTGKTEGSKPTGTAYTTCKNKINTTGKLEIRKFDKRAYNTETGKCGMHVIFKEDKLKG